MPKADKSLYKKYCRLERTVCDLYRISQQYVKDYKDFYEHDHLMSLFQARLDRNDLGVQMDHLCMKFDYCNNVFASNLVWDSVPLCSNKKGWSHIYDIRHRLSKVQDYARAKQKKYRHAIRMQRVRKIRGRSK